MYDPALSVGRIGYEVQYRLAVDPRVLVFDGTSKKLGTRFDPRAWAPMTQMPPQWSWVADPTAGSKYLPDDQPLDPRQRKWFITRHHDRYRDTIGYQSYRVWPDSPRVVCQLELISAPLERAYGEADFQRDIDVIYQECLAEMLEVGIVGAVPTHAERRQQGIAEQVNLEIDDGSGSLPPTRKLACLALGLWGLGRWRPGFRLDHHRLLLEHLTLQVEANGPDPLRYDVVTNVHRLMTAWMQRGAQSGGLSWPLVRRALTEPAWVTVLTQCLDNRFSCFYVHGLVRLTPDQLGALSARDLARLRKVGIDSLFADVWAPRVEAGAHLTPGLVDTYNVPYLRSGLDRFCHVDEMARFVSAHAFGEGVAPTGVERVSMPLFHLRKTLAPGRMYMELRCVHRLRNLRHPRYPYQFSALQVARKKSVQVHRAHHLHRLGTDLAWLFEVAMVVGAELLKAVERDDDRLVKRQDAALGARVTELGAYLDRYFDRPWWTPPT